MRWYADNSELNGIRDAEIPDILVFGGVAVPVQSEQALRKAIEEVKERFGHRRAPVKWNFKDLKSLYEKQNKEGLYTRLRDSSKEWREEVFKAVNNFDFTIIIACIESYSIKRDNIKDKKDMLTRHVFSNALMRLGLHARDRKPDCVQVVLDWPDKGKSKPFDLEYASAFSHGRTYDKDVNYSSGRLANLGFLDSPVYANMHHSTMLQFADLVVGATRELIECAYEKKESAFGVDVLKHVSSHFRGAPKSICGRGISVPSGNVRLRTAIERFVKENLNNSIPTQIM
ncbi:DUF3800 domain-containing protein [Paraburkholderia lacunae]|uniref:DUF3800 domain-containing protein n=1 Tax=Paraburkholderia lacunae TaxID=2211104 RepID=UPI0014037A6D|nr:DUF3800 domain-containing protein [Paraburkholderia lacunae]